MHFCRQSHNCSLTHYQTQSAEKFGNLFRPHSLMKRRPPPPPPPQLIYAVGLSTHLWTLDSSKAKQQLGLAKDLTLWLGQNPNFFCRSSLTVPLFKDNFFGTKLLPDRTVVTVIQKHTGCPETSKSCFIPLFVLVYKNSAVIFDSFLIP